MIKTVAKILDKINNMQWLNLLIDFYKKINIYIYKILKVIIIYKEEILYV
jgi:hypothetical protein